jgi:hypothetical protein
MSQTIKQTSLLTMRYLNSLRLIVLLSVLAGTKTQANSQEFSSNPQIEVRVADRVVGKTPTIIGINTGDMPQGSAFPEWVRSLGVNGARLRLNVDPERSEDPKISSATDLARKAKELRAQAENKTPLLWRYPSKMSAESLRSLRESKIELLATITCPYAFKLLKSDGKTNWSNAWSFWEAYYAQAYQLATQHQVRRYQLFNEPNHKESAKLTQDEYAVRMVIGTDAIQAAFSDAAQTTKTDLSPLISAPCTAGISNFKSSGKPDERDSTIGWGELSMRDRHRRIDGKEDSAYDQFQQYAVQHYSTNPDSTLEKLRELQGEVRKANRGKDLPLIMSEYNIHTARDFAKKETTMDSPEEFSNLGSMAVTIAESSLEELYFFRLTLSQNLDDGQVKKNGVHHVNEDLIVPEITGSTRAAEVIRLATSTLTGGRERLATQVEDKLRVTATRQKDEFRVLLARTNQTSQPQVQITLPTRVSGSLVTWEAVTSETFGNCQILSSNQSGKGWQVDLPSQSVGLLTLRSFSGIKPEALPSTSATSTSGSVLQSGGTDLAQTLFTFGPTQSKKAATRLLHLKGNYSGGQPIPLHLYALRKPADSENGFPFRKKQMPKVEASGLTVSGLGTDVDWLGGFTYSASQPEAWIDITSAFERRGSDGMQVVIARDVRKKGDQISPEAVEWTSAEIVSYPR